MQVRTLKNVAILGLTQVGIVAGGVLAAGACYKLHTSFSAIPPAWTVFATNYGHLALVVPLLWSAFALYLLWRDDPDDERGPLAFVSGVGVTAVLLVAVLAVAVAPSLRLLWCCHLI